MSNHLDKMATDGGSKQKLSAEEAAVLELTKSLGGLSVAIPPQPSVGKRSGKFFAVLCGFVLRS